MHDADSPILAGNDAIDPVSIRGFNTGGYSQVVPVVTGWLQNSLVKLNPLGHMRPGGFK